MSSIMTNILNSIVGLLWKKARDAIADKLKDGDVTDAKIREIVVRELNDMKTKIGGLSRKDLLTSFSFLQEGVDFLSIYVDKPNETLMLNETQEDPSENSRMASAVESGNLNEALRLSHAIGKLNGVSYKKFEIAIKRFRDACKTATHAFCTESLNIQDRILAAKLRIVSEIMESLESPETAITGCLSFLKKLHSLPAIQEIFNVYLNGGVKSMLKKAERVENVTSVMLINFVLFQYSSKFGDKYCSAYTWPTIELTDRSFNPILSWREVSTRTSIGEDLIQHPNGMLLDEKIWPEYSAVNCHGDVVVREFPDHVKFISKTGKSKVVKLPEPCGEGTFTDQYIAGLGVDNDNNVYQVESFKTRTENGNGKSYVLYVLDEHYTVAQKWMLDFFEGTCGDLVRIAINKNNNIIMVKVDDPNVYICDNTGKLRHKFEHESDRLPSLCTCGPDGIMISSRYRNAVHIYSEEGNLKSTIKLPEGHKVRGVAFHYAICKIIVLTYSEKEDSYFLLGHTEAGVLETTTFFCKRIGFELPEITSHLGGPVAVVRERSISVI